MGAFVLEQPALAIEATAVADEATVGADDAVAGDHDRDAVAAVGESDRAARCGFADGASDVSDCADIEVELDDSVDDGRRSPRETEMVALRPIAPVERREGGAVATM